MTQVALIFGGRSPEHEVSIVSARFVAEQLQMAGFAVQLIGVDRKGRWWHGPGAFSALENQSNRQVALVTPGALHELGIDVVFSVIHGVTGEDGCVQGLCEMLDLPFVGGGMLNQNLCWDKIATRTHLARFGLPQPDFLSYHRADFDKENAIAEIERRLHYPIFVKPARTGSSIGVSRAQDRTSLIKALETAFTFDYRVIVEQGLEAREIEIAGLGSVEPQLSIAAEIVSEKGFYDFEEKYLKDTARFVVPAPLTDLQRERLHLAATKAWRILNCYGMARIDFLLTDEAAYLNEINTCPGFTRISMYPRLLRESGIDSPTLMRRLIDLALTRRQHLPRAVEFTSNQDWYKGGQS